MVNPRKPKPLGSAFGGRFKPTFVLGSDRAVSPCSSCQNGREMHAVPRALFFPAVEETPWKSFSPGILVLPFSVLFKTHGKEGT